MLIQTFLPEISEQEHVKSDICLDSTRESRECLKEFLQEKDLHGVDHLLVHRLQDMDYFTLQMHY